MNTQKNTSPNGLTATHKRVYECVPAIEAQQLHMITSDMKRRYGIAADKIILMACINDLIDEGLVVRSGIDRYRRTPIKSVSVVPAAEVAVQDQKPQTPACAIEALTKLAGEMRECASHFASRFKLIADRIDDVALTVDQSKAEEAEAVAKLRQLQSILKGL